MTAVSVIVPAHNASATIADTLATLRSEAETIGEVILVDDSSTDNTAAVAADAASRLALPLRVVQSGCRDAGGSRNLALTEARFPWIYMIDADDLHLEGGLRTLLSKTRARPGVDMVVGAYRRRTDGQDRQFKTPAGYMAAGLANASAYLEGRIRSIAVGSALVSRHAVGDTRFPTGLAYDEDTLFWARVMSKASLEIVTRPIMIYLVSSERSDDRFVTKPARRFLEWRLALRELADCGIPKLSLKAREGIVALKIARVHYARGDLETAAKFLTVAEAAPKVTTDIWRCMRYRLKIAVRRRFPTHRIQLQRA
ncbi:MAG: glycosyltransferase family 2 protein [Mesorhizobium sp.]|uniref:glycosyltransferase family 2 protein n=1 Tax=Mesorhizobium sp. TaxID=1871066 RepID=UPI000FE4653F|nr:glycosyltransferase family 2 protein [Mesorhizobium sp.]RWD61732.1 MAG: glycosyltransferase family 2 protein [Mesorhizobium sp.]RWE48410.1 MAG: glycosyltransferase family 2 protein [Mesorhizobium sp.]